MRATHQHIERSDLDARVAALKQQHRDADERLVATGRATPREINRKNALISGRGLKLDLTSGGRLR
jgi:hypothetical protein